MNYVVLGNGNKVIKQSPSSGDVITTEDTIYLITNDTGITVPNVVGLSSKVAKDILQKLGIKVNLDGVGYVTSQSVSEGTVITDGMEIILNLSPKFNTE
jgi:penicillin-binding protein 2B